MNANGRLQGREEIVYKQRKAGDVVKMSMCQYDVSHFTSLGVINGKSQTSSIDCDLVINDQARQVLTG